MRNGFEADYFLADAWFGNKTTIRLTEDCDMTALLRMKKDQTKYRFSTLKEGEIHYQMRSATELFQQFVRKQWDKIPGTSYQSKVIDVELNIAKNKGDPVGEKCAYYMYGELTMMKRANLESMTGLYF